MVTRAAVRRRAAALGVAVEFRRDAENVFHEIVLTAPARQIFRGVGVHECVISSQVEHAPIETLYAPALDDMAAGLVACPDPACEWCTGEGGE